MSRHTKNRTKDRFLGELMHAYRKTRLIPEAMQKRVEQSCERGRKKFEAGDCDVILPCMYLCTWFRMPPPLWLRDAFCDRAGSPENFETWNDAFGPPMPHGTKKAAREKEKNYVSLVLKIRELRARGIRGQALYEQAADELSLGRSWEAVRDAYYSRPKNARDGVEFAASALEAEVREKIRSPDGQLAVSLEKYVAWLKAHSKVNLWDAIHTRLSRIQPSASSKPAPIKRKS
jgi:hypothetical protein